MQHPETKRIYRITISNPSIGKPVHGLAKDGGQIYPRECRQMVENISVPSFDPSLIEVVLCGCVKHGCHDQQSSCDGQVGMAVDARVWNGCV